MKNDDRQQTQIYTDKKGQKTKRRGAEDAKGRREEQGKNFTRIARINAKLMVSSTIFSHRADDRQQTQIYTDKERHDAKLMGSSPIFNR